MDDHFWTAWCMCLTGFDANWSSTWWPTQYLVRIWTSDYGVGL